MIEFSVVIPSRNRPGLLRQAINSVLSQSFANLEVIVVNDGSDGENETLYQNMSLEWPEKVRFIHLPQTSRGHGPSYAINRGVEHAAGKYIGFLDDDDFWTDKEHLQRAWTNLTANNPDADLYFANQHAYAGDHLVEGDLWLAGMQHHLQKDDSRNNQDVSHVSAADLINYCPGKFAHLNTMIVKKELYNNVGGMDEDIRYECEWDLYLRLLAGATAILYSPCYISRHNVPDPTRTLNVSTGVSELQKLLSRKYVLDKAILFSSHQDIQDMAKQHKIYTLKKITEHLLHDSKFNQALYYAREARIRPLDIKWRIYSLLILFRALIAPTKQNR